MGRASRETAKFFAARRDEKAHRNRYEASRLRRGRRGRDMTSKDNFEFAHAHRKEVAWMSQNTNTLPVHPAILDAIRASADEQEFNLYPRKAGVVGLSEAIKEDLRLDDLEMILTNGGIEGEYIATRALLKAGDEVLSTDPAFLPIHDQVAMAGARAIEADIYRAPYGLTPERALESVTPATKLLLVIDPNNPPGSGYSPAHEEGVAAGRAEDLRTEPGDDSPDRCKGRRGLTAGVPVEGQHVRHRPRSDWSEPGGRRRTAAARPPRPHARGIVPIEETRRQVPPRLVHRFGRGLRAVRPGVPCGDGQARGVTPTES